MSFLQRLRDVLGIDEAYDEDEAYDDLDQALEEAPEPPRSLNRKVVGMPGLGQLEMVMMQPRSFQEIPQAVDALRERKSVILDLTLMEPEQAQRSADYVAGGAYAIDGHQRHLGTCIFLFTPSFVQISSYAAADSLTQPPQQSPRASSTPMQSPVMQPRIKPEF